jgi:hypothetical protein
MRAGGSLTHTAALQVVSTHYEVSRTFGGQKSTVLQYQMVANSQVRASQEGGEGRLGRGRGGRWA